MEGMSFCCSSIFVKGLISLVSKGEKENLATIIEKCQEGIVYEYIQEKYSEETFFLSEKQSIDVKELNDYLKRCGEAYDEDYTKRKLCIHGEDSGILYLIAQMVS